ncbi:L-fucose/L-arabinose isomerase family protein [Aliiroseovarius sp. 2305UL8-7]|uniref:L-fucose/L-arabinose isomerase family protein n=1 Tax=Aliiroseovarius conchicola TaxID=3121637 RepID=UPI0035287889
MKLGILPLGRPTFDVPFAKEKLAAMFAALEATGHELVGPRDLLFSEEETRSAVASLQAAEVDQVLILQVTFTDASMTVAIGAAFDQPLSIWAVPEPRLGGRLRLNAFCGLNLAAHALGLNGRAFGWLYADPSAAVATDLGALLAGERPAGKLSPHAPPKATEQGHRIAQAVHGRRIARIGEHPAGFDTCAYDKDAMHELAGVAVDELSLDDLFAKARAVPDQVAEALHKEVSAQLDGIDAVDPAELDRSLRLKAGLDDLRGQGGYDAFAIRCWPETFTEYGGAVCGPASMLGEARVPCACEADVYGALTQLILMEAANAPVFLTDLVDMDNDDNTGVVWHCGQAPISMCDPEIAAEATIHTNRKQPLLYQFPLKSGEVTLMRISQAHGRTHMVLSYGEMLKRPMAFTGTSGVLRFERPANAVLNDIIASGLEHHMALAYGDHRTALRGVAGALGLLLLEL